MKFTSVLTVALGAFVLAGCQPRSTLEEAQALCTKQGGLLTIIYTQKITIAGPGPQIASPGDCISPSKFDEIPLRAQRHACIAEIRCCHFSAVAEFRYDCRLSAAHFSRIYAAGS